MYEAELLIASLDTMTEADAFVAASRQDPQITKSGRLFCLPYSSRRPGKYDLLVEAETQEAAETIRAHARAKLKTKK